MTDLEKIDGMLSAALDQLYLKDHYLICNKNSERGIVFRFGLYFDEIAKIEFPLLNVDTEYNRDISDVKRLKTMPNGVLPDLILHERGTHDNNFLVLEFKSWWNTEQDNDKCKIESLCNQNGKYKYKYGATILLSKTRECVKVKTFSENKWDD